MQEQDWLNRAFEEATVLLQDLIRIPSFSKEEYHTAGRLEIFFGEKNIPTHRSGNNVWTLNKHFDAGKPTILLNSHHDTVKPNAGYTLDPFEPLVKDDKLYGLGSNDAGASLVTLLQTFLFFYEKQDLKYNLIYAATAEEEISGINGIASILDKLGPIDFAVVGEPTEMHLAVAEKGLLVLDCIANGKAGHAARNEGENAIYNALKDIEWFRQYTFPKISETLGAIKMTVTEIHAGTQHNVVPATCKFTVDIRCTEVYSFAEILDTIREHTQVEVYPRSYRLRPSSIPQSHPFVQAGIELGRNTYGSPTTSDQALMPFTSVKIGPGNSSRSHQADEYIELSELKEGIDIYTRLLGCLLF